MAPRARAKNASSKNPGRRENRSDSKSTDNETKSKDQKHVEACRQFPIKISRAALRYKASKRIIEISKPHERPISNECESLVNATRGVKRRKPVTRKMRAILARKAMKCPDLLTDEEIRILMTPGGIYRSALTYEFTPWMEYLSLPSYRFLKERDDETAKNWKAYILEENETRGRRALEEKERREQRRLERERKRAEGRSRKSDEDRRESEAPGDEKMEEDEEKMEGGEEKMEGGEEKIEVEEDKIFKDENGKKRVTKGSIKSDDQSKARTEEETEKPEVIAEQARVEDPKGAEEPKVVEGTPEKSSADEEEAARRRAVRNAWRFLPPPCKKGDPFAIKRSALRGKVSPRMAELAVRKLPKALTCKKNPFAVRKSALTGPIPDRVPILAIPNHPRDPIERPPPREKDSFGRPIYPMPPYGRKMPRVRPFPPAECPDRQKKKSGDRMPNETGKSRKKERKRRYVDPIVYEPTIDPCHDPGRSRRQIRARKAAKEELERRREERAKENAEKREGSVDEIEPEKFDTVVENNEDEGREENV